jgi:hypothetical protein
VLSLSVYFPVWLGLTWVELRRETKDEKMEPLWHALSVFVPGYGYWQVHRHFGVLATLLARAGSSSRVDALTAALGTVVWSITWLHYSNDPVFIVLNIVELLAATAVVVYGQRALNEYWRTRSGDPVPERVVDTDWLVLAAAATYFVLTLLGYISPSSN